MTSASSTVSTKITPSQETIFPESSLPEDICLQILEQYLQEDYRSLNKAFYKRQNTMWEKLIKLITDQGTHPTIFELIRRRKIKNLYQLKFRLLSEAESGVKRLKFTESEQYLQVKRNPDFNPKHLKELDASIEQLTLNATLDSLLSAFRDSGIRSVFRGLIQNIDPSYIKFNKRCSQLDDDSIKRVQALYFNRCGITRVPQCIKWFTALKRLELGANRLTELPKFTEQFKGLKFLELGDNRFSYLPAEICELSNLEELYMSDNQLDCVPSSIGKLKKLKKVYFRNNQLTTLPHSIGDTSLKDIRLSGNPLKSLPNSIDWNKIFHDLGMLNWSGRPRPGHSRLVRSGLFSSSSSTMVSSQSALSSSHQGEEQKPQQSCNAHALHPPLKKQKK